MALETVKSPSLSDLAASIKSEHAAIVESTRNIVGRAIKIGQDLLKAKEQVGHGNFLKWVKDNCDLTDKTAERYMKLAANQAKLKDKIETISNLTLKEAERVIDGKAGSGGSGGSGKTALDKIENAWDKLDLPTQEAFVEAKYNDIAKLMKEIDRKSKAAA
jgi:hypothetical protein